MTLLGDCHGTGIICGILQGADTDRIQLWEGDTVRITNQAGAEIDSVSYDVKWTTHTLRIWC